tara:strand:+ start:9413 stop:10360 length:948 start_codon:yes stop_codon:yes gene_type:complete
MSLNILITGASGFLGLELCKILSTSSHKVTALDIRAPHKKYKNIIYEEGSIDKYLKNNKVNINKFNLIIHAASILPFKSSKEALVATNVNTTLNLVKHVSKLKNTFFVYISSSGVYGDPYEVPITQNTKFNPLDLYARTKIISEENIKKYLNKNSFAIIRPRTILGKNRKGIFEIFFKLIKYNIPLPVPNGGRQKIQFVEVEDLARLIIHIGQNNLNGEWPAGAPEPKPLIDHLNLLGEKIGKKIITFNLNEKIFYFVGIMLIKLKLINFTKWHFGSFPKDFYFEDTWVPKEFNYLHNCEDAFINSSKTYFDIKY